MTLNATSSIEDINAAYVDNSAYDTNRSAEQAQLFVQACRVLLLKMPKMATNDRASLSLSPELLKQEMQDAKDWLSNNPDAGAGPSTAGGTRHFSFKNLRDNWGWR